MKVAVIGAGAAGLVALKRCLEVDRLAEPADCVVFEKTDAIGGTWVYVPETGKDKYGLPIHSSMYNSLRTNLPKEVMGYPDFPHPQNTQKRSYLTRTEVLQFLENYAKHFKLKKHIKFHHNVELVEPLEDDRWSVQVRDLSKKKNNIETFEFDAVMVCNGHYSDPWVPYIKGAEDFKGQTLHSHDYRVPEPFADKRVVVIGAGPSGLDLALEISKKAKYVIISHHLSEEILTEFPENVSQRPDIIEIGENIVYFKDDTEADVDVIFYCTGYKYSFPFLSKNVQVEVDNNMVTPLWKHIMSCMHPTLIFIGLPFYVCAFNMFDLQVRFVLECLLGNVDLPDRNTMLAELAEEKKRRLELKKLSKRQFHMMGPEQREYYEDLATTAIIEPLLDVYTNIHNHSSKRFLEDLVHYREDKYIIINSTKFWTSHE